MVDQIPPEVVFAARKFSKAIDANVDNTVSFVLFAKNSSITSEA